jgi:hypothetical protein
MKEASETVTTFFKWWARSYNKSRWPRSQLLAGAATQHLLGWKTTTQLVESSPKTIGGNKGQEDNRIFPHNYLYQM